MMMNPHTKILVVPGFPTTINNLPYCTFFKKVIKYNQVIKG